jgi:hypothetical protein
MLARNLGGVEQPDGDVDAVAMRWRLPATSTLMLRASRLVDPVAAAVLSNPFERCFRTV